MKKGKHQIVQSRASWFISNTLIGIVSVMSWLSLEIHTQTNSDGRTSREMHLRIGGHQCSEKQGPVSTPSFER